MEKLVFQKVGVFMKRIAIIVAAALALVVAAPASATYKGELAEVAFIMGDEGDDTQPNAIHIRRPDRNSGYELALADTGFEGDFNEIRDVRFQPGTNRLWYHEYEEGTGGFLWNMALTDQKPSMEGFEDYGPEKNVRPSIDAFDVSPDGARIAYVHSKFWDNGNNFRYRLVVASTAGIGRRTILGGSSQSPQGTFIPRFELIRWAPDGRHLAVSFGDNDIWSVRVGDGKMKRIARFNLGDGPHSGVHSVDWSPDGRRLAVQVRRTPNEPRSNGYGIWVMNADGSARERVAFGSMYAEPKWSPGGSHIFFLRYDTENVDSRDYDLWRIKADGSEQQRDSMYDPVAQDEDGPMPESGFSLRSVCTINGGGNRVIRGTPGRDVICGTSADEKIVGGRGRDIIFGGGGRDELLGRGGRDVLNGQRGADMLGGGRGADLLVDIAGRDALRGGAGSDQLYAIDLKNDAVKGGTGFDRCWADSQDDSSCERFGHR